MGVINKKAIKKAILNRIEELGVTLKEVCVFTGVSYNMTKKYYIEVTEAKSAPHFRSEHVIKLGKAVGVNIRVVGVLTEVSRDEILKGEYVRG